MMTWRTQQLLISSLVLLPLACGTDVIEAASDEADSTGSEATNDDIGEEESTGSTSDSGSTEDSSSEDSSSDDSSSDDSTSSGTTDDSTTDDSTTSDGTTTDDSTDGSTTDGSTESDTMVDPACTEPTSFMVEAVDWVSGYGWEETMSMLGEGVVLSLAQDEDEAQADFEFEIPCDDTWHIWVRGIEEGSDDSFWLQVDAEPMAWAVFELDCTSGPNNAAYKWREINWRDPNDPLCTYLQDPWLHDWAAGPHTLSLGYRESWAFSRIWFTNTADPPP